MCIVTYRSILQFFALFFYKYSPRKTRHNFTESVHLQTSLLTSSFYEQICAPLLSHKRHVLCAHKWFRLPFYCYAVFPLLPLLPLLFFFKHAY